MHRELDLSATDRGELANIAQRYLWWGGQGTPHGAARMAAQIMNLGTYDDISRLERLLPAATLASVMREAQPGWFSARSWEFWRGRLHIELPPAPPVRDFADAS
jgi:hypothetical protein